MFGIHLQDESDALRENLLKCLLLKLLLLLLLPLNERQLLEILLSLRQQPEEALGDALPFTWHPGPTSSLQTQTHTQRPTNGLRSASSCSCCSCSFSLAPFPSSSGWAVLSSPLAQGGVAGHGVPRVRHVVSAHRLQLLPWCHELEIATLAVGDALLRNTRLAGWWRGRVIPWVVVVWTFDSTWKLFRAVSVELTAGLRWHLQTDRRTCSLKSSWFKH